MCLCTSDSEPLYSKIFQRILDAYGKTYTWEVKLKLMGRQAEETARTMVEEYDLPIIWEEFAALTKEHALQMMGDVELLPGTVGL